MLVSRRHLVGLAALSPGLAVARGPRTAPRADAPDPRIQPLGPDLAVHTLWSEQAGIWHPANFVVARQGDARLLLAPTPDWPGDAPGQGWWWASLDPMPLPMALRSARLAPLAPASRLALAGGGVALDPGGALDVRSAGHRWRVPRRGVAARIGS
jgi:hypothetical protein